MPDWENPWAGRHEPPSLSIQDWEYLADHHFDDIDEEVHEFFDSLRDSGNKPVTSEFLFKNPDAIRVINTAISDSGFQVVRGRTQGDDRTDYFLLDRRPQKH